MATMNTNINRPKIFIIDDVEQNRFLLRDIIANIGYQPILVESGEQALKLLNHVKPEVILLDIAMPEMDGYELCERLKNNITTREIPIIFISAFDDPTDVVKGFTIGGSDYITKPFVPEIVQARVNMQLKLYEANKRVVEMNKKLQASVLEQVSQLETERKRVLYTLLQVVRENAAYDEHYMDRLSNNCAKLAEAMQLSTTFGKLISDRYIKTIELASPLCDIGNISVPTNILQKTSELTVEEFETMKKHTTKGARLLSDVGDCADNNDFIEMAIEIANYHHENWNGTGYPEGKVGDEIPLSAQIVGLVSVYCSLTENRSYRTAYEPEQAIEIMQSEMKDKFNPEMLSILIKIRRQLV